MNILSWIILGQLVGISANLLDTRPSTGSLISAIILGIAGAIFGGLIASLFLGVDLSAFNFTGLIVATLGSLTLLAFGSLIFKERRARWS